MEFCMLLRMLLGCGFRLGEPLAARVKDINFRNGMVLCQKKVQVKRELHLNILNYTVSISSFLNSFQYFFSCSFGDS